MSAADPHSLPTMAVLGSTSSAHSVTPSGSHVFIERSASAAVRVVTPASKSCPLG